MSSQFYEFGRFRLDSARRLLLRDEQIVALTPKAFDTLLALVEQSGQVVEKDELMRAVWGETIVEEVGLARNVSALRKALGEHPDEHRYIVTVPGRGYRFVEHVRAVPAEAAGHPTLLVETHTVSRLIAEEEVTDEAVCEEVLVESPGTPPARRGPSSIRIGVTLVALAALVALGLFVYLRPRPVLTERDAVLVAHFVNSTGDAAFDRVLEQGLAAQLEQSPFLNVFPGARVGETLRMMGRSADEPLTVALAREVSLRHGIKAAVTGDITALGQHYVLTLEAINAQTGESLARAQTEAAGKEDVLRQLSEGVKGLRQQLGESLSSIQQFHAPIEQATTASLEALQAYSLGREKVMLRDFDAGKRYYQRAVELDPNFAVAWNALADLQFHDPAVDPAVTEASITRAYALRDRTSEIERIRITVTWHEVVTKDLDVVLEEAELFRRRYPQSWRPYWALAVNLMKTGQNESALRHARELVMLNPDAADHHFLLADILARLDELDEARAVCLRAGVTPALFSACGYLLATPPTAGVRHSARDAAESLWQTMRAAQAGQWRLARQLAGQGRELPARQNEIETQARLSRQLSVVGALVGDCHQTLSLPAIGTVGLQADAIVARALCGDLTAAERFIALHQARDPRDTLLHGLYLPTVRAALALGQQQPDQALVALEGTERFAGVSGYWPTWLRGEAYLNQQAGAAAALEFQQMVAHPGLYLDSPLLALAHLGLGRAAAQVGDLARSHESYQEFFEIWKDADPDLPILVTARQEYDRLR